MYNLQCTYCLDYEHCTAYGCLSIHIAVLFLSLFRVYLFLWLISVSFQSLKMTSHLVSFYHSCLLLKFESHLLPQSKLLYAEKERRGFCLTSKEKKATKKFWISDGYFSVYTLRIWIREHARQFIFQKYSTLFSLIKSCSLIKILKYFSNFLSI